MPMIYGIGNDIIEVARIEAVLHRHREHFLAKIFTPEEQRYCLQKKAFAQHLAGRFAAKESLVKALGTGIGAEVSWLDFNIKNDAAGKPFVFPSPRIIERFDNPKFLLSISHCRTYASAVALWVGDI
jgi:holo-[acyl-carrier protein] synthase